MRSFLSLIVVLLLLAVYGLAGTEDLKVKRMARAERVWSVEQWEAAR